MSSISTPVILTALTTLVNLAIAYDIPYKLADISSSCEEASEILFASEFGTCANLRGLEAILRVGPLDSTLPPFKVRKLSFVFKSYVLLLSSVFFPLCGSS